MIVNFDRSFSKSLDKSKDRQAIEKLKELITKMETVKSISDLSAVKPMKGHAGFFRVRLGDYRVGFAQTAHNEILLILIAHRKDIYKRFP